MASRWQRAQVSPHEFVRPVTVGDEVHDGDEEEADRLGEVKQFPDGRVPENAGRGTNVRLYDPDAVSPVDKALGVLDHLVIVVDVSHAGVGRDSPHHLVDVVHGWQARADVKKLANARLGGQITSGANEEVPVLPYRPGRKRLKPDHLVGGCPIVERPDAMFSTGSSTYE